LCAIGAEHAEDFDGNGLAKGHRLSQVFKIEQPVICSMSFCSYEKKTAAHQNGVAIRLMPHVRCCFGDAVCVVFRWRELRTARKPETFCSWHHRAEGS
jgi:hypothetical protein